MSVSVQQFFPSELKFGGTGIDGEFHPASNYNFSDAEGSWVIKEYSSITIDSGIKVSTDNRVKGLILNCSGDVVINGEIDLDGKAYGAEENIPIVFDRYSSGQVITSAWAKYCSSVKGGNGGGGGGEHNGTASGGNGAFAGGSRAIYSTVNGGNASGWTPGRAEGDVSGEWHYSVGGSLLVSGFTDGENASYTANGGDAGYLGVQNAGGNSGGIDYSFATLTTASSTGRYGGSLLVIIAKGNIVLGSSGNIHCRGINGFAPTLAGKPGGGGSGGGNIVLLSQGTQTLSGTQSVAGGSGGAGTGGNNIGNGGDGGNGGNGTIINQQVN